MDHRPTGLGSSIARLMVQLACSPAVGLSTADGPGTLRALRHCCPKSTMPPSLPTRRAAQVVLAASIVGLAAFSAQAAPSGGPRPGTGCGGALWRLMTLRDPHRDTGAPLPPPPPNPQNARAPRPPGPAPPR